MTRAEFQAALAAHRFGLGEADLATVGADPVAWLTAQIGAAEPQRGTGLASGLEGVKRYAEFLRTQRQPQAMQAMQAMQTMQSEGEAMSLARPVEQQFGEHFRTIVQADVRARMVTATLSAQPFNERLALFWANHFTVSTAKASARGVVGAFEREAIRPHIAGTFDTLLKAVVHHAGMLRYLDNDNSAGPDSAVVRRQARAHVGLHDAAEVLAKLLFDGTG